MQARQIESELDAKTTAFGKLCSGHDGSYRAKGESGLAAEQVKSSHGFSRLCLLLCPVCLNSNSTL